MKNILTMVLTGLVLSVTSCKEKDKASPSENAISTFLTAENGITLAPRTSGPWELGVVFSVSKAGKITQLGSKMPDPGIYRVIIWDFETKQLLRQKSIEQTAPDQLVLDGVESLELAVNKRYVVSINSQSAGTNKRYLFARNATSTGFMPFTQGSVLVHSACYIGASTATFPGTVTNVQNELYGLPEFTFIPD
ncbi:hypothetical protein [Ravibacter arvi]